MKQHPIASLSIDLDDKWSYLKTHGDASWSAFPSYLEIAVPRVLEVMRGFDQRITFFVVGQDAALARNHGLLRSIADAGHEIGNHSFLHEPWLHLYSPAEVDDEIRRAEEAIEEASGKRPIGFRGPGFSLSETVLNVLQKRGYLYDASTFPTFLGPLARAYYFRRSRLTGDDLRQRGALFGSFREGFRPLRPYRWSLPGGRMIEIPVTTLPILKVPIHVSYLLYIGTYSRALAVAYFRAALGLCSLTRTPLSLLLHPPDFLGPEEAPELAFFPAMSFSRAEKLDLLHEILTLLFQHRTVVTLEEQARRLASEKANVREITASLFPKQAIPSDS
jgi:peptidoglycan/xylan/chitin deacetylase (PgdA/CDA1 family)